MANFEVLKPFENKKTGKSYKQGQEIEMTVKRSQEVESNAKDLGYNEPFLKRIKEKK
ncbi:hypothetical protein [Staphylococcus massiliensis]|uniref:Gp6 protein n=1 Tax=Staphylococcus massiliensis S46 TaxID=1229783 RepID=K9AW74_9STAP|nr:hypothetical protein [Staphylococcus massiliensis]EKU50321.1 gp6 protein [Staphylococcus massiliensis S46]MCG3401694.1 hypothetical protein [Staphylococcus massiliensis]